MCELEILSIIKCILKCTRMYLLYLCVQEKTKKKLKLENYLKLYYNINLDKSIK